MIQDEDRAECWIQSHSGTKAEADAFAADIEKLAALSGHPTPRVEVAHDPQGGWNVWIWEG
jgi:hypothetical protein